MQKTGMEIIAHGMEIIVLKMAAGNIMIMQLVQMHGV
jgi:hypothetical protein